MNSKFALLLLCSAVLATASPASAQHRQFQQHFQQQPRIQQHFGGGRIYQQPNYYGGGYVVQPSQPYCYDTNTGAILHWGNCYGNSLDYGIVPQE
jgi:2',3'-cyclic-nucleotide 2'-phosphodiesterase (5'-nucleotidase family)